MYNRIWMVHAVHERKKRNKIRHKSEQNPWIVNGKDMEIPEKHVQFVSSTLLIDNSL